jgi:hypothetical protein
VKYHLCNVCGRPFPEDQEGALEVSAYFQTGTPDPSCDGFACGRCAYQLSDLMHGHVETLVTFERKGGCLGDPDEDEGKPWREVKESPVEPDTDASVLAEAVRRVCHGDHYGPKVKRAWREAWYCWKESENSGKATKPCANCTCWKQEATP